MIQNHLNQSLVDLSQKNLRRRLRSIEGPQGREILLEGRKVLNFCSNNYLGLADDPRLIAAAMESLRTEGFGSGASRLVCGNLSSMTRLEQKMAEFKGTQAALVFSTGYMANVGIIAALFGRDDTIFCDRLNHASIIDGILLSGADFKRYPHADVVALEKMLQNAPTSGQRVIITDSVFSMDGDIAPLPQLVALANKYDCCVMVDEAHGLGVLGQQGQGAVEHFNLHGHVDIQMGTFSKAVGSFGAYVCGTQALIDTLINKARSLIYTTGLPPSVAAASLRGVEIIQTESARRQKMWTSTALVLQGLKSLGFETMQTATPIIPVLVKDAALSVAFSEQLLEKGIFVSAIRPPTVPINTARLRLTVTAAHTPDDIAYLLEQFAVIGKHLCLI